MTDVKSGHAAWMSSLLGAPMRFDLSASGGAIEPDRYGEVAALITNLTHRRGEVLDRDGRLDWRNTSDVESLQITVQSEQDQMHVRIRADYAAMTFFAFFAILFSGMFVAAALGGFAFQPSTFEGMALIGIVGAVGSYAAARAAWKSFAQKRCRDLQKLLDSLTTFSEDAKNYDEVAQ
ncbi:MAG: hypothetical protein CME28_06550 [Gemmatimonadetes bacterium]|nr:hypothetical protein [Gemmatimonadota bacterium]|tara:strand:+ start:1009 stop:1542 length:534 start_codon:yes stop_codon:yes gene_type:complete